MAASGPPQPLPARSKMPGNRAMEDLAWQHPTLVQPRYKVWRDLSEVERAILVELATRGRATYKAWHRIDRGAWEVEMAALGVTTPGSFEDAETMGIALQRLMDA